MASIADALYVRAAS
jgi:hypothetical protein